MGMASPSYEIWNYHDTPTLAGIKAGTAIEEDMFGDNSLTSKCKLLRPCMQRLRKQSFQKEIGG